jgi:hypothetical protein
MSKYDKDFNASLTPEEANRIVDRVLHWGEPKSLEEEIRSSLFNFLMRYWMQLNGGDKIAPLAEKCGCEIEFAKRAMESHKGASIEEYLKMIEGLENKPAMELFNKFCSSLKEVEVDL